MEGWFEDRARSWNDGSLADAIESLRAMSECPWRLVAAAQAVKLELKRQWQLGQQVALENYLAAYPELGGRSGVAADVILAEMKAKSKAGLAVDLEDYVRRYPNQSSELRALVAESSSAAAGSTRKMRQQTPSAPRPVSAPAAAPAPPQAASRTAKASPTPRPSAGSPPPAAAAEPHAALPELFGRYRIEKQLGQGGMGSVYKAYDTDLHRHVALKVPQFGPEEGAEVLERFKQEARAAATLRHTNLCQVYDVGAIDGTNFLTMEFIEGQSLEGYLNRQKEVSPRFIALVMTKLARALKTAHAKNVIHRDLKPSNIMLRDADGTLEPVIVDFGLARRIDPGTARLTQSGLVIGTWQYMTPEQLCGEPDALGPACDIYALGVIMYELLTGRLPFDAPGQVVRGNAATPRSLRPDLDPRLEAICLQAMASSRDARYASMGDLATALTEFLRAGTDKSPEIKAAIAPSGPRPPEPRPAKPSGTAQEEAPAPSPTWKTAAGVSAGALAVAGGALGLWIWVGGGPGKGSPAAPDRAGIPKSAGSATPPTTSATNSERLFDDAWSAIRSGRLPEARAQLARYVAEPGSSKTDQARVLLADLDHALSKSEARIRAKAQGDAELKKHIVEGVKDLLDGIQTPELREAYAATLVEAFREEEAARSASAPETAIAANRLRMAIAKKSLRPPPPPFNRAAGPAAVPVRELEPGYKLIYNGQSYEGWDASVRRFIAAKKGIPKGLMDYFGCPPQTVARREGSELVSNATTVGILRTEKLFQLNSLKFDYVLSAAGGRPLPKVRNVHAVVELFLDKPLDVKNMNACGVIGVSLTPGEAGNVATSKAGNRGQVATLNAVTSAARQNGEWNAMEIKYADRSIQFLLNGVEVNRLDTPRRITAKVAFSFGNVELRLANIRLH